VTPDSHDQAARHDPVYDRLAEMREFGDLRHRYRRFVFPASIAFLSWYFLYVILSMFAPGLMGTQVVGTINVALVIGLLQFVTTFLLAYLYSGYSNRNLDPLARELTERFDSGEHHGKGN